MRNRKGAAEGHGERKSVDLKWRFLLLGFRVRGVGVAENTEIRDREGMVLEAVRDSIKFVR